MPLGPASGPATPGEDDVTRLVLRLGSFEGPLDLLLALARAQKVDLAQISILALVEQFLAILDGAHRVRLELAADWLVMAAWMAWLKSRLLLPPEDTAEPEEDASLLLASRLIELESLRAAASWLAARPQLGRELFARGTPESLVEVDRSRLAADAPGLVRAYLDGVRRAGSRQRYRPRPAALPSVAEALERLGRLLGAHPGWSELWRFLPHPRPPAPSGLPGPDGAMAALRHRAGLATTLLAGLELARGGTLLLRQDEAFGPILLRPAPQPAP